MLITMCKKVNYKTCNTHIDKCMRPLITFLRYDLDLDIVACCCGHNKYPMTIIAEDIDYGVSQYIELLSNTKIPRSRRFYIRDDKGYYYIPEVTNVKRN